MSDRSQLFGRIALGKGFVSDDQLFRALRFQEEIRSLGLSKQLGEILLALESLSPEQVEVVLRLQAINLEADRARRFGRIAIKNDLINLLQFEVAFEKAQAERFARSLGTILQELEYIDARHCRAVTVALDRLLDRDLGRSGPGSSGPVSTTDRLSRELNLDEEDTHSAEERRSRIRDLTFAAVALREGRVLVPELERAVREQLLRVELISLEDLLLERGVLGREDVEAVGTALEASRHDRLAIPGYSVLDVEGFGATSIVLRARHDVMEREVAIKLFHADYNTANAEALAEEARAVAAVKHPNVVGIYEVGRVHRRVYYVMELVHGLNLAEVLRERGPFDDAALCRLARELLSGLHAIHEHGIVHRDVKPLNVLIAATDGTAKLTDMGLACESGSSAEEGVLHGSPLTMSPEQAQGDTVDARADLYGLGATLYTAATGRPPFEGRDVISILMSHMTAPVPDPRELRPELGEAVAELIMGMLAKDPQDRPKSAAEALALPLLQERT